ALGDRRRRRIDGRAGGRGGPPDRPRHRRRGRRPSAGGLHRPGRPLPGARAARNGVPGRKPKGGAGAVRAGVPTEIKADESRVALTPVGVRELSERGHEVIIQAGAGGGSAIDNDRYVAQGARIAPDAETLFAEADLILKVKEPQQEEVHLLEPRHTLFT